MNEGCYCDCEILFNLFRESEFSKKVLARSKITATNIALPKLGLDVDSMNFGNHINISPKQKIKFRLLALHQLKFFNLSLASGLTLINAPKTAMQTVSRYFRGALILGLYVRKPN